MLMQADVSDDDNDDVAAQQYIKEVEAEAKGISYSDAKRNNGNTDDGDSNDDSNDDDSQDDSNDDDDNDEVRYTFRSTVQYSLYRL
jgi:ribonuclease E